MKHVSLAIVELLSTSCLSYKSRGNASDLDPNQCLHMDGVSIVETRMCRDQWTESVIHVSDKDMQRWNA